MPEAEKKTTKSKGPRSRKLIVESTAFTFEISGDFGAMSASYDGGVLLSNLNDFFINVALNAMRRDIWNVREVLRTVGGAVRSGKDIAAIPRPELFPGDFFAEVRPLAHDTENLFRRKAEEVTPAAVDYTHQYVREHLPAAVRNAVESVFSEAITDAMIEIFEKLGLEAAEQRNTLLKDLQEATEGREAARRPVRLRQKRTPTSWFADLMAFEIFVRAHQHEGSARPVTDAHRTLAVMRGISEEAARDRIKAAKPKARAREKDRGE